MPALITELVDRFENSELICTQIGAILLVESLAQQALATQAGKDPALWKLRVFVERSCAWDQFQDPPDASDPDAALTFDSSPIVNISFDQETFDKSRSNVVERQTADGVFNIDCFGLGISADLPDSLGHLPGDAAAAIEAKRAYRLCRSILMGGAYTYLGFPRAKDAPSPPGQIVWGRWVQSIQMQTVPASERTAQHIVAARIALQVTYSEFSPQVIGVPLELISTTVTRSDTGQVLLTADYPIGA